jgi:uncharacterized membrane protein YcaP (DUF421 family)
MYWGRIKTVVNSPPTLVLFKGQLQHDNMKSQRVAEADVRAALRQQGLSSLGQADAVILEADGTFSVIRSIGPDASALIDVPSLRRLGVVRP